MEKTDEQLIQMTRQGDLKAYGDFVRRHQRRIYRLAVHMVRDRSEAEDVTQETFVRAYQGLDRFQGSSKPYTWLYRIALNISLNLLRARKVRAACDGDDPRVSEWLARQAGPDDPETQAERQQLGKALCEGIDSLSETLRITLLLVCIDGLDHQAACEVLGCPEGTVSWRVHEARKKLAEFLESRGLGQTEHQS